MLFNCTKEYKESDTICLTFDNDFDVLVNKLENNKTRIKIIREKIDVTLEKDLPFDKQEAIKDFVKTYIKSNYNIDVTFLKADVIVPAFYSSK